MTKDTLNWTTTGMPAVKAPGKGVQALNAADIEVVFQPIVDITTGKALAHEALVRCSRPEYASPPVLFEHAVEEEACGRLGRTIREVAFSTCGDVALFVNLHPAELASRWLVRPDDPIGFQEQPVYLEITESATFTHYDLCRNVLAELCSRTGALLVVDDFGAGYSNLDRLARLEPAVVKLDIALIHDIHEQKRKQIVTRHVVRLCEELGARVVAEGVEKLDELKCVRDLGVSLVQGYLFARPATPPPAHTWPLRAVGPSRARASARPSSPRELSSRPTPVSASKVSTVPAPPTDRSGADRVPRITAADRNSGQPRSQRPPRSRR